MMNVFGCILLLLCVSLCGCGTQPTHGEIEHALLQDRIFAEPEVWHVSLGPVSANLVDLKRDLYNRAQMVGLIEMRTQFASPEAADAFILLNESQQREALSRMADEAKRALLNSLNVRRSQDPDWSIQITDKGRELLRDPSMKGSSLDEKGVGFAVAHYELVKISSVAHPASDTAIVEFQWRHKPTAAGKILRPALGTEIHTNKALFRIGSRGQWEIVEDELGGDFDFAYKMIQALR